MAANIAHKACQHNFKQDTISDVIFETKCMRYSESSYSTGSATFISFMLTNVDFRISHDFFTDDVDFVCLRLKVTVNSFLVILGLLPGFNQY